MDSQMASTFRLLWIMPLWTRVCKYLLESPLSVPLDIYLSVGSLDPMGILYSFWGTAILVSTVAAPFYTLTSKARGFQSLHFLADPGFLFCSHFYNNPPDDYEVVFHRCCPFYNLTAEMTSRQFCCVLFQRNEWLSLALARGRKLSKGLDPGRQSYHKRHQYPVSVFFYYFKGKVGHYWIWPHWVMANIWVLWLEWLEFKSWIFVFPAGPWEVTWPL